MLKNEYFLDSLKKKMTRLKEKQYLADNIYITLSTPTDKPY